MSQKKNKNTLMKETENRRAAKKAAVLGSENKKKSALVYIVALTVVLMAGSMYFFGHKKKETQPSTEPAARTAFDTQVTFPVSDFDDGMARHFQYSFANEEFRGRCLYDISVYLVMKEMDIEETKRPLARIKLF